MDIFEKIEELRKKHEQAKTESLRKLYESMIKMLCEEIEKNKKK